MVREARKRKDRSGAGRSLLTGFVVGALLAFGMRAAIRRWGLNQIARVLYNLSAPIYDPLIERFLGEHGAMGPVREQLVDMLELEPGDRVLEVSVGTGDNLPFIAAKIGPEGHIDGLDISEGMLAQARKKLSALPCPVALEQGLAEALPYPDNSFDAVLHLGGINFFDDRRRALIEMARVAKPGAKIVVADETIRPHDGLQALLARLILPRLSRLRPPVALVPDAQPALHYLGGGYVYAMEWRKAG